MVGHNAPWTVAELTTARATWSNSTAAAVASYKTTTSNFNYATSVIVKAAGNDAITSDLEPLNYALASDSNTSSRLLIVGALSNAGFVDNKTSIANYSNTAGNDTLISERFVMASGNTPFASGWVARNGVPISGTTIDSNGNPLSGVGTSYAAPRVAGYVAIVRQKFPNLDAVKTANIMLDTAGYETLTCNPNCDVTIYGKGEVNLSRALAPVGRLR